MRRVASTPFSFGILISMSMTSGGACAPASRLLAVRCGSDDFDIGLIAQHVCNSLSDDCVIVSQHDPYLPLGGSNSVHLLFVQTSGAGTDCGSIHSGSVIGTEITNLLPWVGRLLISRAPPTS